MPYYFYQYISVVRFNLIMEEEEENQKYILQLAKG